MSYKPQDYTRPLTVTDAMASEAIQNRITFFSRVFTKEDTLAHPKSVYKSIINSPDKDGNSLEVILGSKEARTATATIMFQLTTGHSHT